jgi:hypothetical protein
MSAGTGTGAGTAPARERASDVLVAQQVIDEMRSLNPVQAASVARAIKSIGHGGKGVPIKLTVPGAPLGVRHYALVPADNDQAPVVIYRSMTLLESGRWRVTSLMSRTDYEHVREAETSGLLDDDTVKALLVIGGIIVAGYALSRLGGSSAAGGTG